MAPCRKPAESPIAQSLETCVVDSMPRAAIEAGYAGRVVPLEALPNILQTLCQADRARTRVNATDLETPRNAAMICHWRGEYHHGI